MRIFLAATVLLCFCGRGLAGEKATPKAELRLWHQWRAQKQEILSSIIEEFNCQHENIKVLAEPLGPMSGTVAERMLLDAAAARPPELALVERGAIPVLADAGAIRPLEELVGSSAVLQRGNLLDSARSYVTYNGELYGLPSCLNPFVLICNSELLAEAGISAPPSEWSDLINCAGAISKGGPERRALNVRSMAPLFHILCLQRGVNWLDVNGNSRHALAMGEILEFIRDLRQTYSLLPPHYKFWDPSFAGVTSGKVLFQLDTGAMVAHLLREASIPLTVAMVPSDSVPARTSLAGSDAFVVSRSAGDLHAIMEFFEFFYSSEQYSRFVEDFLFVSPLKNAHSAMGKAIADEPMYSTLVLAAENAGVFPLRSHSGTVLPEIARAVDRLDAGLISPDRALEDVLAAVKEGDSGPAVSPRPSVRVTWAESTRRLFGADIPDFRTGPVEIVSARNEHETFQLAVSSERRMDGLNVNLAPFQSENGRSYELKTVTYLETDTPVSTPLVAQKAGPYPNVLRAQSGFSSEPGVLTRIWVDVFVPDDVPTGKLSSEATIAYQGLNVALIPVRLRVLPLRLPTAPSQPAVIGLNYELIARHYNVNRESEAYRKLMDSFYWFLVEHRLSPFQPPVPMEAPETAPYLKNERVSACRLPFHPDDPRFQKAVALAKVNGWLEKLFAYFIDEPTYHQYGAIIGTGEKIHSMSVSPKFLVTCFPDDPLIGAVDIWCIHMGFLPAGLPRRFTDRRRYVDAVSRRLEAGDEVWWYTAGGARPFPTLHIEDDPAAFRIIPWLQQLYRIAGFLHWESANWGQPFDEPFVQYFGNGEGVLVYPGNLQPSPSIRLELLREGLEDMEYLILLRQNIEYVQRKLRAESLGDVASVRVREICRRLISEEALRANFANGLLLLPHFIREPGNIERVRREVAEETIALQSRPFAVVLTEPEEKQYTDSANVQVYGAVERGCKIEVNGHELAVDRRGKFSAQLALSSGTNVFRVRLKKGRHSKTVVRKIEKF